MAFKGLGQVIQVANLGLEEATANLEAGRQWVAKAF